MVEAKRVLVKYYRWWEPYWFLFALAALVLTILNIVRDVPSLVFLALGLLILPALMGNMLVQEVEER